MVARFGAGTAAVALALFVLCGARGQNESGFLRELPLHRFAASRHTQTDARGFYFMPTAVEDDYFDGTSPISRVERHFAAARAVGA